MAIPKLSIVDKGIYELGREPDSTGDRVQLLQEHAKILAREQVEEFHRTLLRAAALGRDIVKAGEVVPPGLRDIAGRVGTDMGARARMMEPLMQRFNGSDETPKA